jgi:hypothetical protein
LNFSTLYDLNGNVDLLTEKLTQTIKDAAKSSIPKFGHKCPEKMRSMVESTNSTSHHRKKKILQKIPKKFGSKSHEKLLDR